MYQNSKFEQVNKLKNHVSLILPSQWKIKMTWQTFESTFDKIYCSNAYGLKNIDDEVRM